MKEVFNIVRGAVSTKDLIPVLTHFAFNAGTLQGFNGRLAISTPTHDTDLVQLNCTVPAIPLLAAIDGIKNDNFRAEIIGDKLSITNLTSVAGASFNAHIPIGKLDEFPLAAPDPIELRVRCETNVLPILRALRPFMGEDASRPWVGSMHFFRGMATVTNNVMLVRTMTTHFLLHGAELPVFVIDELLRIGVEPESYVLTGNTITFYYRPLQTADRVDLLTAETFVRCSLFKEGWPDADSIFTPVLEGAKYTKIPNTEGNTLLDAVEAIAPFCPDASNPLISFDADTVSTVSGDKWAKVSGLRLKAQGTYRVEPLKLMLGVAERADWTKFPRVPFQGKSEGLMLQGILLGIRI